MANEICIYITYLTKRVEIVLTANMYSCIVVVQPNNSTNLHYEWKYERREAAWDT